MADLTFELETIDREKAQQYIGKNVGNRPVSQAHLNQLIGRQRRGEWKTNGDSFRFDANGALRDGQHRLHMVMLTGIPIEAVVIRGVDPEAFGRWIRGKPAPLPTFWRSEKNLARDFSLWQFNGPIATSRTD